MGRLKAVLMCFAVMGILGFSSLSVQAHDNYCSSCGGRAYLAERTYMYEEFKEYHVVQMGTTSVGCYVYTRYYDCVYKCNKCGAYLGVDRATEERHSVNH